MAVVIDKSLFGTKEEYRSSMESILDLITDIVKREMHVGGIVVQVLRGANVNLRQDYTVLLSIATCYVTWRLHEAARKEELTHLAITDPDCPRIPDTDGISVPLVVPGDELSQIFLDLRMMNVLSWNMINILHDDTFERDTISRVLKAISDKLPNKSLNLISRSIFTLKHDDNQISRKGSVKSVLSGFRVEQLGHCFLVIATVDMVADVMEVARSLNMVDPGSQWLYVVTDSEAENVFNMSTFVDFLAEGGNVAFMYNATDIDSVCEANLTCYVKELIQALAGALEYSLMNEIELLKRVGDEDYEIVRMFKRERRRQILKNIRAHLARRAFASETVCGRCLLWKFSSSITWGNFFSHDENVAHLLDIGTWTPGFGGNLTDVLFPHIAHGFRGVVLPITTYQNPPWQIISVSSAGEKRYEGLVFDVVRYLSQKLNFTYTVITPNVDKESGTWNTSRFFKLGEKVKDMKMSNTRNVPREVISLVHEKKVLLAACAYTVNEYGKDTINFTVPIFVQTYSFLTSRPRQLSRVLLFASPFTKETWAFLAVSIIIMGPILYLVHKYSPFSTKTSGLNSSWQCVWYVYGALLQQGGMYLPQSDSARILIGAWWMVVMVLVATYSGSLVAFLTFPRMDVSILTVEELISRRDGVTWGFPNGSFLETYLRNSDEQKYQILLSRAERHNDTERVDLVDRVKEGKHALIDWRSSLRFLMRKDLLLTGGCHFSLSGDEFLDEPIAMIMPQGSPYLPIINAELHRMHESGLMHKWISERMPMKDKCWEVAGSNQAVNKRKVNVADMQGIFFVLFIGVTLAFLFLFLEFYWNRRKISKERKLIRPFVSNSVQIEMGTSWLILLLLSTVFVRGYDNVGFDGWYQPVPHRPVDIITDVINDLAVRILQQYTSHGNVAFSPTGVGFVLAALYEGSAGRGRQQIADALGLPRDRDITRIGFRDIHRRLRTYLNPDAFLGGLTLNQEYTRLRGEYEDVLRFYGFDLSVPDEFTETTPGSEGTTMSTGTDQPATETEMSTQDEATTPVITQDEATTPVITQDEAATPVVAQDEAATPVVAQDEATTPVTTQESMQVPESTSEAGLSTTSQVELVETTLNTADTQDRLTQSTLGATVLMDVTEPVAPPGQSTTLSEEMPATMVEEALTTTAGTVQPTTMVSSTIQSASTAEATVTTTSATVTTTPATVTTTPATLTPPTSTSATEEDSESTTPLPESTTTLMTASTVTATPTGVPMTTAVSMNVPEASMSPLISRQANEATSGSTNGPPADQNTVSTDNQTAPGEMGSTDLPGTTTVTGETGSNGQSTTAVPSTTSDTMSRRKRSFRGSRGYFSSYPDEGIWMQDLGIWKPYSTSLGEASVRDSTEISFLVNGCDVSSVTASRYFAVLPFAYFPSLHAVALEFPLDDPRYNILLLMSTDRRDTYRLSRDLGGKSLRLLRKQLQATWVRATIPSFMLRGFVTLTSFLQRLGIVDVFEPRAADLSPMTPDLGVYARDVQQSIGVNIRNYMKPDRTHSRESSNPLLIVPPRRDYYRYYHPGNGLFERAGPVPFTAVHPFLYFIVDAETSVALIAGRVNDPLNSRIL
ncbi:ionotropic receptor 93a-like [Andrena cerasifolii]|uniref:ionotropic receptor 93a-like n=1 Tax=Andrena cerasifolii TaxID=2819439 RepID=UPI004038068A